MFSQLLYLHNELRVDWISFLSSALYCLCFIFKQNEENKKKNKRAALKAAMDLEEARKAASEGAEQQKNNNVSLQDHEGEIQDKKKGLMK